MSTETTTSDDETETEELTADDIREFASGLDFETVTEMDHVENVLSARSCSRDEVEPASDPDAVEFIGRQYGHLTMSAVERIIQRGYIPTDFVEDEGDAGVVVVPMSAYKARRLLESVADGIEAAQEFEPEEEEVTYEDDPVAYLQEADLDFDVVVAAKGGSHGGRTDYGEDGTTALFLDDADLNVRSRSDGDLTVTGNTPDDIGRVGGSSWGAESVQYVNAANLHELHSDSSDEDEDGE